MLTRQESIDLVNLKGWWSMSWRPVTRREVAEQLCEEVARLRIENSDKRHYSGASQSFI